MPKYLIISHNTGRDITHYHTAEAENAEAAGTIFDDVCQATGLEDIYIDALTVDELAALVKRLDVPPTLMAVDDICARIVADPSLLDGLDIERCDSNWDIVAAHYARLVERITHPKEGK